jgi:uncharacterized protein with HEPN domain
MSERDERVYLGDMLTAARTVLRYMHGRTRADLDEDGMLRDAVVRQLEVLGEAAVQVSETTRLRSPLVPWRAAAGRAAPARLSRERGGLLRRGPRGRRGG